MFAGYSLRKVQALAYIRKLPYALRKNMADIPLIGQLAALSLNDTAAIYADSRSHFGFHQIAQS
ncbi:MAG: hypothetical protein HC887_03490 [Desulfobacteraceae bacterium]|nr:hypothetical protein [Desulfobacteraceae bacterium]